MKKVYYNQADSRWANHPYPSKTLPKATIKSGGCGVTCAAMVVSSSKEIVKPDKMGDISRSNGYRANSGTAWELFSYVAKRWNFKTRAVKSSYEALQACKDGYFVVILCGSGLWTTGGHYILAVGAKDNKIEIYDPYLYNGKFDRYNRKGKVELKGNSCWVQIDTFKKYSNARKFFAYKMEEPKLKKKSNKEIAKEVIDGKWSTGENRKKKLEKAGYNYKDIQNEVNKLLKNKKSVKEIAREVINGKWGNGEARKKALEKAGYNYKEVQKEVNKLI